MQTMPEQERPHRRQLDTNGSEKRHREETMAVHTDLFTATMIQLSDTTSKEGIDPWGR